MVFLEWNVHVLLLNFNVDSVFLTVNFYVKQSNGIPVYIHCAIIQNCFKFAGKYTLTIAVKV